MRGVIIRAGAGIGSVSLAARRQQWRRDSTVFLRRLVPTTLATCSPPHVGMSNKGRESVAARVLVPTAVVHTAANKAQASGVVLAWPGLARVAALIVHQAAVHAFQLLAGVTVTASSSSSSGCRHHTPELFRQTGCGMQRDQFCPKPPNSE